LNSKTIDSYQAIIAKCRSLFHKKTQDYGTAWRILRISSITDQIFIKAQRIRSIQEKGKQLVEEDIASEFIGIVNYCIIALIQLELTDEDPSELPAEQVMKAYDEKVAETIALFQRKNHDYGEAWRDMRVSSITDIILMKIFRVKQIEDNSGQTLASEGVDANYQDMMNYAVFCLIKMGLDK
jgi:Nucleotide modification associated domain 1